MGRMNYRPVVAIKYEPEKKPRCGVLMPQAGLPCGRPAEHKAGHATAEAVRKVNQASHERKRRMRAGEDPERYAEWKAKTKRRYADRKAFIDEFKLESGCVDCGYRGHPEALQFDHVRGEKLGNIAQLVGYHESVLLDEMAKCEVVCANCHAIRTCTRRQAA